MRKAVEKVLEELKWENEEYGERIVSLEYAYESAIEKLEKVLSESENN